MVKIPDIKELMKAGVHFGHKTAKWNPKMKPYIYGIKGGIHIFDLEKTRANLAQALEVVESTVAKGGVVLFLGTKKQIKDIVKKHAQEVQMPYIVEHWIGGLITNFHEISKLVKKMEKLEEQKVDSEYEKKYTKRERSLFQEEIDKLKTIVGGIGNMPKVPDLIFIAGSHEEKIACREAKVKGIKTVGIVDANANPDNVSYVIPANDDAIKSVDLITGLVAEAVKSGKKKAAAGEIEKQAKDIKKLDK